MDAKKVPSGRAATNTVYGVPGDENSQWYKENIITLKLPYTLYYENDNGTLSPVHSCKVHRLAAPNFLGAFLAIWLHARTEIKKIHGYDLTSGKYDNLTAEWLKDRHLTNYNGTYNYRPIRGSKALSTHAYGIAIDLDASGNPLGATATTFPAWFIKCWTDQGFLWGGDYKGRKDNQHWQLARGV